MSIVSTVFLHSSEIEWSRHFFAHISGCAAKGDPFSSRTAASVFSPQNTFLALRNERCEALQLVKKGLNKPVNELQALCRVPLSSFWFWKQDFPLHPYTPPDAIGSSRKLRLSLQGFFDSLERCEALEIPFRMCRKNTARQAMNFQWTGCSAALRPA